MPRPGQDSCRGDRAREDGQDEESGAQAHGQDRPGDRAAEARTVPSGLLEHQRCWDQQELGRPQVLSEYGRTDGVCRSLASEGCAPEGIGQAQGRRPEAGPILGSPTEVIRYAPGSTDRPEDCTPVATRPGMVWQDHACRPAGKAHGQVRPEAVKV